MTTCGKLSFVVLSVLCMFNASAQLITEGKITYERRTNVHKKFNDERMRDFIKGIDKIKTDNFSLVFNDSVSYFSYIVPETPDKMPWLTMKNAVYNNYALNQRTVFMDLMGSQMIINDTLVGRQWKITGRSRTIAGYNCTRAVWAKDDSTNIYAWFTTDILPTVGPENVQGLPGAILGLATEDGGVVYFATKVEAVEPTPEQIAMPKKKGKEYTQQQLYDEIADKMKGEEWKDRVLHELFFW